MVTDIFYVDDHYMNECFLLIQKLSISKEGSYFSKILLHSHVHNCSTLFHCFVSLHQIYALFATSLHGILYFPLI